MNRVDVGPQLAQRPHQDRRRADAVDIVVTVDGDPRTAPARGRGSLHGPADAREGARRVFLDALEEGPGLVRLGVTAPDQHLGHGVADPELGAKRARAPPADSLRPRSAIVRQGRRDYGQGGTERPTGARGRRRAGAVATRATRGCGAGAFAAHALEIDQRHPDQGAGDGVEDDARCRWPFRRVSAAPRP